MKLPIQLGLISAIIFLALPITTPAIPAKRSGPSSVLTVRAIAPMQARCDSCSMKGPFDVAFAAETAAVPGPPFFLLLGIGLAGLVARRRWAQR